MDQKIHRGSIKGKLLNIIQVKYDDSGKPCKYICDADPDAEKKCDYYHDNLLNTGNFKRHVISQHRIVAERLDLLDVPTSVPTNSEQTPEEGEPEAKRSRYNKLCVETNRKQILLGTMELATCHNLPLSFPEWKGMQHLCGPQWKAAGFEMSRFTLTNMTAHGATLGKERIKHEMTGKVVHLKIDLASRGGRHAFGINAQFMGDDDAIQIRTLALQEMVERATKENIELVLRSVMQEYGLSTKQVLSITHDNGQNLIASVKLMRHLMFIDDGVDESHCLRAEISLMNAYSNTNPIIPDDEEENEDQVDMADQEICDDYNNGQLGTADLSSDCDDADESFELNLLESTRCAVHTAQLVVWDVLKSYKTRLAVINKIGITMRHKLHRQLFSLQKVALPPKVVETRWNVWYLLLKYFKELKDHPLLPMLKNQDPSIDLEKHWIFIEQFCVAFHPTFILTLKLQREHVPLSQFYADWLICQAQLNNVAAANTLAKKLLMTMKARIKMLTGTSIFKASLYLDPRFNFAGSGRLTAEDKSEVQKYFIALDKRLDEISGVDKTDAKETPEPTLLDDSIDKYLADFFNEESSDSIVSQTTNDSLIVEITKLESRDKVAITDSPNVESRASSSKSTPLLTVTKNFDILDYWRKRRFTSPRLYHLAKSVLSAPSTQVSVERLFSHFKNVLTDTRMRLAGNTVKDLMILKMNDDLLPKITEDLEAAMRKGGMKNDESIKK